MKRQPYAGKAAWIGFFISAAALLWVYNTFNWTSVMAAFARAQWAWLAVAPLLLLANFALRATRWLTLFPPQSHPRWRSAFAAMMAGYLLNNLLPARAGELLRAHMIGRRDALPRSTAFGTVVLERILDLLVLLALLALVLFTQPLPARVAVAAKFVVALAALALALVLLACRYGPGLLTRGLAHARFLPERLRQRLDLTGQAFIEGLSASFRAGAVTYFLGLTVLIWILEVLLAMTLDRAFGLGLDPTQLLFVLLCIALGTMVPASPGYLGTFEFFGLAALSLLPVERGAALGFVLTLHALLLAGSSVVGAVCMATAGWPTPATDAQKPRMPIAAKALLVAWMIGVTYVFLVLTLPPTLPVFSSLTASSRALLLPWLGQAGAP